MTEPDHDPALNIEGLTVRYRDVTALSDATLTLARGRVCGLVGMNGSGKSTMFEAVMGVVKPGSESIHVFGGSPALARKRLALAVLILERRDFTLFAFDRTQARAFAINPTVLSAMLLALLALTTVVALQAVGVILVVAMLITPGASAYLLTHRFGRMLVIAPTIAVVCALVGIYASFYLDVTAERRSVFSQWIA